MLLAQPRSRQKGSETERRVKRFEHQLVCGCGERSIARSMNEKALYYVEMLLKAADVVNRRSSGTCALMLALIYQAAHEQ